MSEPQPDVLALIAEVRAAFDDLAAESGPDHAARVSWMSVGVGLCVNALRDRRLYLDTCAGAPRFLNIGDREHAVQYLLKVAPGLIEKFMAEVAR